MLSFFFKQKTAYEMRISDWSSDVCSSDLRTVALAQVNGIALAIAEDLKFNMARVAEIFLHIDGGVAKGGFRFRSGLLHQRFKLTFFRHNLHAAPAAARSGLDRSEEHTSELQSLMRISYAVFCLKTKTINTRHT